MSDFKHKENNVTHFKNDYKEKDTQPDMKGKFTNENGEEKSIAGWWKKSSKGDDFLHIALSDIYVKED